MQDYWKFDKKEFTDIGGSSQKQIVSSKCSKRTLIRPSSTGEDGLAPNMRY